MIGLNLIGDLQVDSGLGESTRSTVDAISRRGIPLSYIEVNYSFPARTVKDADPRYGNLPAGSQYTVNLLFFNMPQVAELQPDVLRELTQGKYTIAYWVWELPEIPVRFHTALKWVDEIWTASSYCQTIFSHVAQIPIRVVPHPIELKPVMNISREKFNLGSNRYIFLSSFAASSSDARKNPWSTLKAFKKAFGRTGNDGPLLVIKVQHLDVFPELYADLSLAVENVGGLLLDEKYSRQEVNELLTCADVYVSLHRSEGFGLGMAEAMYYGKPVIATNYSGNTDFMNAQNSYPVSYRLIPTCEEDFRYNPFMLTYYPMGQLWAEPDVDQAAELMTYLYENPVEGQQRGQKAASDIRLHLSMEKVGQIIESRLREIAS